MENFKFIAKNAMMKPYLNYGSTQNLYQLRGVGELSCWWQSGCL